LPPCLLPCLLASSPPAQPVFILHFLNFLNFPTFLYFLSPSFYASPMRSSPRKLSSETDLYTAAINGLSRRAYSICEMRTYLERLAEDKAAVPRILDRLKEHKHLDDQRYARQFVRQRAEIRKQGSFRIARELRARGVPDRHIEAALAEHAAESDEGALVRARLARRLKTLRGPLDERRTASLYNSLLRAGFAADTIRRELRAMAKVSVDESPETSLGDI
jgi:regulatory protein